jgi:hypothetical protein
MVLLVFRSHELHELLEQRHPGKSFLSVLHPDLQGYWKFFGRVDLGSTWFFHAPVPAGRPGTTIDFRRQVFEAAGAEFDVEFQHIGFWDLRFAVGRQLDGKGRIVHRRRLPPTSHPALWRLRREPWGSRTAEKPRLEACRPCLKGLGRPNLLASYSAERRPVFPIDSARLYREATWRIEISWHL